MEVYFRSSSTQDKAPAKELVQDMAATSLKATQEIHQEPYIVIKQEAPQRKPNIWKCQPWRKNKL